jgi:hypothetical protein
MTRICFAIPSATARCCRNPSGYKVATTPQLFLYSPKNIYVQDIHYQTIHFSTCGALDDFLTTRVQQAIIIIGTIGVVKHFVARRHRRSQRHILRRILQPAVHAYQLLFSTYSHCSINIETAAQLVPAYYDFFVDSVEHSTFFNYSFHYSCDGFQSSKSRIAGIPGTS